jgi:hypothetical protein
LMLTRGLQAPETQRQFPKQVRLYFDAYLSKYASTWLNSLVRLGTSIDFV